MGDVQLIDIVEKLLRGLLEHGVPLLLAGLGEGDDLPVEAADDPGDDQENGDDDGGDDSQSQDELLRQLAEQGAGILFHHQIPVQLGEVPGHHIVRPFHPETP